MHNESESACHEIANLCLASRVRQLSRVITAIYDEELRPYRMTLNQLNILVFLSHMSGAKLSELARYLQMEISTASRNLKLLRKGGWILVHEGKDARTREFSVSPQGERKIIKAVPAWRKAQKKANALLGKGTANAIYAASQRGKR
jgi:DNA-binding MarR family transcriptional regulator